MNELIPLSPESLNKNVFRAIGEDWMLVTAEADGKANTMTASWGGMGVMWSKNVAFVVLRPQRYTKQFVDQAGKFSLSFFDASYKKTLGYLGAVSGRNEDKIARSGLTLTRLNGIPCFAEARTVLCLKTLFAQPYTPQSFLDAEIPAKWYPEKDYHTLYIAEIIAAYQKD